MLRLKDDLGQIPVRASAERDSFRGKSGFNLGSIMNFTRTDGINDSATKESFRRWTGIPMTTRVGKKFAALPLSKSKVIATHRKQNIPSVDKRVSIDSGLVFSMDSE